MNLKTNFLSFQSPNLILIKILSLFFVILLWSSCNKCEINPCKCVTPTNANFTIEEYSDWQPNFSYLTDTIIYGHYAIFKAENYNMASYEWKVGYDPRVFRDTVVKLKFEHTGDIEIRLIVTNDIPSDCITNDDGVDTIVKTLTVVPFDEWPFWGNYIGKRSHLSEENHEISIRPHDNLGGPAIYDLQKGDETDDCVQEYLPASLHPYYKRLLLEGTGYACHPKGIGYISNDHQRIVLEYIIHQHQNSISFVGIKN